MSEGDWYSEKKKKRQAGKSCNIKSNGQGKRTLKPRRGES